MYACGNCGAPVAYGQTSCSVCGVPIDWGTTQSPPSSQYDYQQQAWEQQPSSTNPQQEYTQQAESYQQPQYSQTTEQPNPGRQRISLHTIRKSLKKIPLNIALPLIVIFILLTLGGIMVATIANEEGQPSQNSKPTIASTAAQPVITTFTSNPASIISEQTSELAWEVTGATSVSIDQGVGSVDLSGKKTVAPTTTTTYTLTAVNDKGSVTSATTITINAMGAPTISKFTITPNVIDAGQPAVLQWDITGATSMSIDQNIGNIASSGTQTVYPSTSTTYKLTATNSAGSSNASAAITVNASSVPVISSFTAGPSAISAGESSTLQWNVTGASSVSIDQGVGTVAASGTQLVSPTTTTTYTLTATNSVGSATASATVALTAPTPPVIISFTANPSVITTGQSTTFQWNITGATSLSIDNDIGIVSDTRIPIITPSETKTYTITATNSAGSIQASTTITVNAAGAPTISSFTASPSVITSGSSNLQWDVTGATSVSINQNIGTVSTSETRVVTPTETTIYTITATNSFGQSTASVTITKADITAGYPVISSFIANPGTISAGGSSQLSWQIQGDVTSLSIDQGIGTPPAYGAAVTVFPTQKTTYTLTATNSVGSNSYSATVNVQ